MTWINGDNPQSTTMLEHIVYIIACRSTPVNALLDNYATYRSHRYDEMYAPCCLDSLSLLSITLALPKLRVNFLSIILLMCLLAALLQLFIVLLDVL